MRYLNLDLSLDVVDLEALFYSGSHLKLMTH